MEIIKVKISELKPAEYNPRAITEKEKTKKCIRCGKKLIGKIRIGQKYCSKTCWLKRNPPEIKKCLFCHKEFSTYERKTKKYCSQRCRDKDYRGKFSGSKSGKWKGDDVSYSGLHKWVALKLGKPERCEFCGKSGLKGKQINWANKSGKYLRKTHDWLRLCQDCHKKYDSGQKAEKQE